MVELSIGRNCGEALCAFRFNLDKDDPEKKDDKDTTPVEIANDIIKSLDDFLREINKGKNKIEFEANKVILSELDRMKNEGKNG